MPTGGRIGANQVSKFDREGRGDEEGITKREMYPERGTEVVVKEEAKWRASLALMMAAPWANAVQLSLPHHFSYVRLVLARAPLNSWEAERGWGRRGS